MRLNDKVALVTGASRSIGRVIAIGFAREGARVIVNYQSDLAAAADVVNQIERTGSEAVAVRADVSKKDEVDELISRTVDAFGRIDVLVNNAALANSRMPLLEFTEEQWDRVLNTDLKGYFMCAQAAAREMVTQHSGAIINVSSVLEDMPDLGNTAYCCAKGGVRQLTRQLALELADYGIRANAIAPGLIETDRNRLVLADPAIRASRLKAIPLKLIGAPEDLLGAAVYLASEESRLTTGTTIVVDGGASLV